MKNYYCFNPVKILFGKGMISEIDKELKNVKRILLIYGKGSIKKSKCYEQIIQTLKNKKVFEFSDVSPNPEYNTAVEAIKFGRKHKIEFILAAGGGSVIDCAKFVSLQYYSKRKNLWHLMEFKCKSPKRILPFGCIQTCPGSGTESNNALVISNYKQKKKNTYYDLKAYPKFSVLDPELTLNLPLEETKVGIADMFIHVLEQYLTYPAGGILQDRQAEALLASIYEYAPKLIKRKNNYHHRAIIMWCGASAVNGLINRGMPVDWSTHYIGNILTIIYGITHAKALVVILEALLNYKFKQKKEKLYQLGVRIFDLSGTKDSVSKKTISLIMNFFKNMGLKTSLKDFELNPKTVSKEVLKHIDKEGFKKIGEHNDIGLQDISRILNNC